MKKSIFAVALLVACPFALLNAQGRSQSAGGSQYIEPGQPAVVLHATVEQAQAAQAKGAPPSGGGSSNLSYHGGTSDGSAGSIGVETAPTVYLVFWGSQWGTSGKNTQGLTTLSNDPSGEATILQNFYLGVGGSSWNNSVTQYCQGVASGTVFCNGAGKAAGNPSAMFGGVFVDNGSAAPSKPSQSQLASEAVKAAGFFGNPGGNVTVQYVIATSTGNSASGFGVRYCAWHSSTSSSAGNIAYTNLPYITDAGASCGANFNGLGPNAGITIVGGHEMAETESDQFPNGGWLDSGGSENGDKCAWIKTGNPGASTTVSLSNGTYPVQSLWSNAANNNAGGCVLSYP